MGDQEQQETMPAGDIVVVAVDGSEFSDYALNFYMTNIHKKNNHVILVHSTELKTLSFPAMSMMSSDPTMSMVTEEISAEESRANSLVEGLVSKMKDLHVNAEVVRIHGEAGPNILHVANEKKADFIVVGSRGKGTIRRTFTGSVTDYVVHHSKIPVIVTRHKDHHHHHGLHLNIFHHKKSDDTSKAS